MDTYFSADSAGEWTSCAAAGSGPPLDRVTRETTGEGGERASRGEDASAAKRPLPPPCDGRKERLRVAFAALGGLAALVPSLVMLGFTVDDALVPVRYAHHLATGVGYRFNADGPSTDGVTPLPWAFVLAPFARGDALTTLGWAKALGVAAWTAAGIALGVACARVAGSRARDRFFAAAGLVVVALAFPIGAWAASGLETGVATALATLAASRFVGSDGPPSRYAGAATLAGLAAAMRPELVVWSFALFAMAIFRSPELRDARADVRRRAALQAVALVVLAVAPFVVCAIVRTAAFGRPAPLAVWAKPSDPAHGMTYALAATLVVLTPILAFAPWALFRGGGRTAPLAVAFVAHAVTVVAVGGDWMPYARLFVPVAPSLALVFADVATRTKPVWSLARLSLAVSVGAWLAATAASAGRHVQDDRRALVDRARPVLRDAHVVAALDVGWVSAATDARIVDLAGLTDPSIAALAGGHTSKRVSAAMLLDRDVDTVLVYANRRVVEERIVTSPVFLEHYRQEAVLPLGSKGASYAVYRRVR